MIQKWVMTFILLCIAVISFASVQWLESQQAQVEQITQQNRDTIRELQNINNTNQWLRKIVIPYFSTIPMSNRNAELDMIHFYDRYAHQYDFKVSQFIYYDTSAKMDVGFTFTPKSPDDIDRFLALRYENGFLQIQTIASKEGVISGILTIIQPVQGGTNASKL